MPFGRNTGQENAVLVFDPTQMAAVRRLMPIECERLQGMPDNWTLVPVGKGEAADSPRYKQVGNSWAVPHAAWVCRRLTAHLDALDARDDTILPAEIYWLLAA